MAKTTKSAKKVKTNKKSGIIHKIRTLSKKKVAFLSMAAFLLLLSVGYAGYGFYESRQLSASAENWTILYVNSDLHHAGVTSARACKTYINAYGGVYNVKVQVWKKGTRVQSVQGSNWRWEYQRWYKTESFRQSNWLYGVVAGEDLNASTYYKDKIDLTIWYDGGRQGRSVAPYPLRNEQKWDPASLKTC